MAPNPQQVFVATSASFSGPIPPPTILRQYDEVVPGGAERIIRMAEKQSDHRRTMEANVINSDISRSKTGLWSGLAVALTAIVGGTIVAYSGEAWAGATIAGVPTAGLISVFVVGTFSRSRERENKTLIMTGKKSPA